jgi:hypothetical protein
VEQSIPGDGGKAALDQDRFAVSLLIGGKKPEDLPAQLEQVSLSDDGDGASQANTSAISICSGSPVPICVA